MPRITSMNTTAMVRSPPILDLPRQCEQDRQRNGGGKAGAGDKKGQIEKARCDQRRDDPQCVRQDHQPHNLSVMQAQRSGGLPLTPINRPNAGTDDLGDRCDEFDNETNQQRGKLRGQAIAAADIEAPKCRHFQADRGAGKDHCRPRRHQP
ncbi:hypothetical protein [Devosia sp.]|uniref:hypothetical protein n=1 Tax=Devosia sp. TaxID=1871048 RepID=UPI002633EF2B|nr:hypothetical protein [Devosia sp.]